MSNSSAAQIGNDYSEVTKGALAEDRSGADEHDNAPNPGTWSNPREEDEDDDGSSKNDVSEDDSSQDSDRDSDFEDIHHDGLASTPLSPLIDGAVLRSSRFPVVDIIEHYRKTRHIDYDFLARRPPGHRTPEGNWTWSLYKHEWYNIFILPNAASLVGRSVLLEMGIKSEEIPPPREEDVEDAKGLPAWPIRMQDYHQLPEHNAEICHWPTMTQDPIHIPVLDRSLDDNLLDTLEVRDPDNITGFRANDVAGEEAGPDSHSVTYVRLDPKGIGIPWVQRPPKHTHPLVGHLHLEANEQTHFGKDAVVCVANLDLPYAVVKLLLSKCYRAKESDSEEQRDASEGDETPLDPGEGLEDFRPGSGGAGHTRDGIPTRFRVIAKVARGDQKSHDIVNNEARIYGRLPKILSEHWTGYQKVPGISLPQPTEAIVPISFGYYVPDVRYNKLSTGREVSKINPDHLNPIALMEHCGDPIDVDMDKLHIEYKEQLFSMQIRLASAGFAHGSMAQRHWLVQPGPLRIPPSERSLKRPIFHMVDFGRGLCNEDAGGRSFHSQDREDEVKLRNLMDYSNWAQYERGYR